MRRREASGLAILILASVALLVALWSPHESPLFEGGGADVRAGPGLLWLRGEVRGTDGVSVPGVRVVAIPLGPEGGEARWREPSLARLDVPTVLASPEVLAYSEIDGQFVLRGLRASTRYRIAAQPESPSLGSALNIGSRTLGRGAPLHLVVADGMPMRGRVVDERGNGLLAWVAARGAFRPKGRVRGRHWWRNAPFRTAADGTFSFHAVEGCRVVLAALIPGQRHAHFRFEEVARDEDAVLRLKGSASATVRGVVTDADGSPVPDAEVTLRVDAKDPLRAAALWRTHTDASGAYVIEDVDAGVVAQFRVRHADGRRGGCRHLGRQLEADATVQADVVFRPGLVLEGAVRDPQGRPLPGIEVSLLGLTMPRVLLATVRTDAAGGYRIGGLPHGRVILRARGRGWRQVVPTAVFAARGGFRRDTDAGPGQRLQLQRKGAMPPANIVMEPATEVVGRVEDTQGRGMGGILVQALPESIRGVPGVYGVVHERTAPDGRFQFVGLPVESAWRFRALFEDRRGAFSPALLLRGDAPAPLRLSLDGTFDVEGRVVDPQGNALEGFRVRVQDLQISAISDIRGSFRLSHMQAGSHRLSYRPDARAWIDARKQTFIAAQRVGDPLRLVWPDTGRLRGRVADAHDTPVPGVVVRVGAQRSSRRTARTNARGEVDIDWLPITPQQVWIEEHVQADLQEPDGKLHRWDLPEAAGRRLRFRVLDADGCPVQSARVVVIDEEDSERREVASDYLLHNEFDQRVRCDLKTVTVVVTNAIAHAGGTGLPSRKELPGIRVRDALFDVLLERGLTVAGRLHGPDGEPVGGARIEVHGLKGSAHRRFRFRYRGTVHVSTSAADGTFSVAGLGPGPALLDVFPPPPLAPVLAVEAQAGADDVRVEIPDGGVVSGRVRDAKGAAVAGARVLVFDSDGYHRDDEDGALAGATTDREGHFELVGVPRGRVDLMVRSPEGGELAWPHPVLHHRRIDPRLWSTWTLASGARVEVEVFGPEGRPLAGGELRVIASDSLRSFEMGPTAPGSNLHHSPVLGRGIYTVRHRARIGYGDAEREDVRAGYRVRLDVPRAWSIRGKILALSSISFRLLYFAQGGGEEQAIRGRPGFDGDFVMTLPSQGQGVVYARDEHGDRFALLEGVRAPTDGIIVRPQPAFSISGSIAGRVGTPASRRLEVRVTHTSGIHVTERVDKEGSFRIAGLPPGTYRVELVDWRWGTLVVRTGIRAGAKDLTLDVR